MVESNSLRDMDDSNSSISTDSDDIVSHPQLNKASDGVILQQHKSGFVDVSKNLGKNNTLNLPGPVDKPIAHISSVALQNSADITFGNKTLYSGSVTVNQFFNEKATDSNISKNGESGEVSIARKSRLLLNRFCASKWKLLVTTVVTACIVLPLLLLLTKQFEVDDDYYDISYDQTELKIIKREEWKAKPPTEELESLSLQVPFVIIQHTVTPSCEIKELCSSIVRQAQTLHITLKYGDIGYNFLVGGDGAAYDGVGWNKVGAHTYRYNRKSIGIGFIGDFRQVAPPKKQFVAALKLIHEGEKLKIIAENYTLIGGLQVTQTESPGKMLYEIVTKSPHWSDQID